MIVEENRDNRPASTRITMRQLRLTGPGAGPEKYDLLTAMATVGLSGSASLQASMLRLIALVTARYNWSADEVSIGQKEMAKLWSVDERTAKRETKRLIDAGFLELKRRGIRGRVAAYRLCISNIYAVTRTTWDHVGPDYQERMSNRDPEGTKAVSSKVVSVDFGGRNRRDDTPWERTLNLLEEINPARYASWYAKLKFLGVDEGTVTLQAASAFVHQYIQTHLLTELNKATRSNFPEASHCRLIEPY